MKTIAVLGGGSASFTAARIASETGARILFFMGDNADQASLCVNAGCMPSKALFEPIEAMHHAKPHRHVARITRDHSGAFIIETEVAESMAPIVCEKILLATGRRPTVDQLGLEAAGVELNAGGRLEIDESMRVKGSPHLARAEE